MKLKKKGLVKFLARNLECCIFCRLNSRGKGVKAMELSSNGVWVPVEDGVEVLNCGPSARRPGYEDMDEGLQIIEGKSRRARSSHESDSDTLSSSGKRLRPSQFAGLLSNCGHQNLGSSFVTSCMHVTCKICLKSHVESVIEKSMITVEPSYDEIRIQLLCPDQRCGMELSKTDLIHLLDIITVETYENWLRTAYRDLYGAMSSANMINCIKCQQGKAIKCSRMSSIKGKGKAKKNNDTSYLQSAASNGNIQCPDSWVCTNCEFSWCAACGFAFDSQHKGSGSKGNHVCSEATNYRINDIVTDLELIYNEYITGATRSDDQPGKKPCNKYNTRSRKSGNQPGTSTTNVNYHPSGINMGLLTPYGSNAVKTVWGAGTGFGGHRHEGKSTVEKVKKVEKELDCRTESVLKSLANVLKNIAASRHKPVLGFSAYVLFKRENVVGQLLEYLVMNDSMMDICARSALYLQLSDLLKTMTQYPELLIVLVGSCFQIDRKGGSDVHGNVRSDASVIKKMKNIYDQSKIIVNRFKDGNDDKNVEADLDIARCLLECYEKLEKSSEKQAISTPYVISISEEDDSRMTGDGEATSDQTTSASKEEVSKTIEDNEVSSDHCKNVSLYKESLKPLQFGDYPLIGKVFHHHSYSSHFDESGANPQSIDNTGVHNKNRTLHIAKEVASLATNLPLEWESSIHVRVDPVRMDLLKALIVGPKGTPYQNGIFIFDIYLPPDYPQVPPKVNFLTTGCGKVRFNPNLYADGKVCLSLLGTWDGPSWQPWKSTLLQVLVSIQSLIFVAEPFYNEPGHETWAHCRDAAEGENRNHRYNTLKIAILGALRDPDSSFKEVILTHFQHKKDEIVSQCKEWITASGDPTHKMYSKVVNTANEVVLEVAKVSPL